jgi:2-methylcitrate dehydratase PrpD
VKEFTDEWVRQPAVVALSDRVFPKVDPSIGETQTRATITLKDGRQLEKYIAQAVGSVEQPMSDADLDRKVRDLCDGVLPASQTQRLIDLCRTIEREPGAQVIADLARRS